MTAAHALRGFLLGISLALFASCATPPAAPTGQAVSEDQVYQIAIATVTHREGWPGSIQIAPNVVACILCQPRLNADGSWRVLANRVAVEESTGNNEFLPNTGRIIEISRDGKVIRYTRIPENVANG